MSEIVQLQLIDVAYTTEDGRAIIEVYGNDPAGRSVVVRVHGFVPYCYVGGGVRNGQIAMELASAPGVISVEETTLTHEQKELPCVKVCCNHPNAIWEIKRRYERTVSPVFSADITYTNRFIFDYDLRPHIEIEGEPTEDHPHYHVDLVLDAALPDTIRSIEPFPSGLSYLSFDIENSIVDNRRLFVIGVYFRDRAGKVTTWQITGEELTMLSRFAGLVRTLNPDIITGYNIHNYDITLLMEKAESYKFPLSLGRNGSVPVWNEKKRRWLVTGRAVIDAWWEYKVQGKAKKQKLNDAARDLLGDKKDDVDPKEIDSEWKADKERVCNYCVKDAELALRVLDAVRSVRMYLAMGAVSRLPFNQVVNGSTSQYADSLFIRAADRVHFAVPLTRRTDLKKKIPGGYVHKPIPGLHSCVLTVDFKSTYPSIMIKYNICITTFAPDAPIEMCHVSPVGAKFLKAEYKRGLLPDLEISLGKQRAAAKAMMKKTTDKERDYWDDLQAAIKVLMNAMYGLFASDFYRFTNQAIGASITKYASDGIIAIVKILTSEKQSIVFSDTDSLGIASPTPDSLEKTLEFGNVIVKRFSKDGLELDFEKVMMPFFNHGKKKRYFGQIVWPKKELLVKGYENKRRDSFDYQSKTLLALFDLILKKDTPGAIALAKGAVAALSAGQVPLSELTLSKSVKEESSYKDPNKQIHVLIARKMRAMGYPIPEGMSVSYIVTKAKPQEAEPFVPGITIVPDLKYYSKRLAGCLGRVTETFGWSDSALGFGNRQAGLAAWGVQCEVDEEEDEDDEDDSEDGDEE